MNIDTQPNLHNKTEQAPRISKDKTKAKELYYKKLAQKLDRNNNFKGKDPKNKLISLPHLKINKKINIQPHHASVQQIPQSKE